MIPRIVATMRSTQSSVTVARCEQNVPMLCFPPCCNYCDIAFLFVHKRHSFSDFLFPKFLLQILLGKTLRVLLHNTRKIETFFITSIYRLYPSKPCITSHVTITSPPWLRQPQRC
eukprot:Lithocolla_globosa_v1_NODE_7986_length_877_cov_128.632603.p2 type:complete len:115 gc:universal NODE_7986_length_877_cov_128.632603:156-500(+)